MIHFHSTLPIPIPVLLEHYNSPLILQRHLQVVHHTAQIILQRFKQNWQNLSVDEEAILFGAGSHDIGKVIEVNELYRSGKKHEEVGYQLLIENSIPYRLARFAKTHGDWSDPNLYLEDLLVALADKIWKGKRITELEEKVCQKLEERIEGNYWEIFIKLDEILMEISLGADERLTWQKS